ncbi:MAG: cobalamin B12-binding domain-containing protein [Acholeplasmataceae bacterium]|jgi:methanogenic corrinoid protein MtbC1|nr:cobalamin B12-binding domain-containing protein [Acholeplasmataceae bacterium]
MSKKYIEEFMNYVVSENKKEAVNYAYQLLAEKKMTIESLYLDLLAPSLTHFECMSDDEEVCIWKEHFRTSIIRTILETSYIFILERLKDVKKIDKKIVVLTPAFEYHEIGAIMNTHFLLLEGFDANYIGANTPKSEILSAIRAYQPDYVALSVTNPYNLVITKQTTDEIRRFFPEVKIIIGGQAFVSQHALHTLSYDFLLQNLEDLKQFAKEVTKP